MTGTLLQVLLVDDQPADAEQVLAELRRAGFAPHWRRVETETDYAAALHAGLDLILADYALPQFQALNALRLLRLRDLDVPLIVITAQIGASDHSPSEEAAVECMRHGAADYLLKDRLARLGPAVTHALREKQLRAAKRRADQIQEVLFQISQAANLTANLEELLKIIHQQLGRLMDTSNFYVALYDEATDLYSFPHVVDEVEATDVFTPMQLRKSLTDYVRRTGAPLLADDETFRQLVARGEVELVGAPSPIWLGAPLKTAREVIGVVVLQSYTDRGLYSAKDLELLAFVSDHLALAVERKRALDAERKQLGLARTLQEVGALLTTQMSLEEVFESIFDLLAQVMVYDSVSVQMLDEDGRLYLAAGRGFPDLERAQKFARSIPPEAIQERWERRRVVVIADTHNDPRWIRMPGDEYIRSWVGAALVATGKFTGVLNVDSATPKAYDESVAGTVITFANQAAVAIENARLFQAEREQRELGEALRASGHALSTSLNFNAVLDHVLELIGQVVPYDSGNVMLVQGGRVQTARLRGYDQFGLDVVEGIRRLSLDLATTPNLRHMAETGEPRVVSDAASDPAWVARATSRHIRSWVGAPIMIDGHAIGFFSLDKTQPNFYRREHAERLSAFAAQAALALQNARLFTESQRREIELATLLEVGRAVSSSLRLDEVLRLVALALVRTLSASRCVLSAYEPESDQVRTLAAYRASGEPELTPVGRAFTLADFPATRRVLLSNETVVVRRDDPQADPAEVALLRESGDAAVLIAPLSAGGRRVGLAELFTRESERQFSSQDVHMARALADQAGVAVENAQLYAAAHQELQERRLAEAQAEQTARQLVALSHMGQTVAASLELADVLEKVNQQVQALLDAEGISILLLETPDELVFSAVQGAGTPDLVGKRVPVAGSVAGQVVRTGRSIRTATPAPVPAPVPAPPTPVGDAEVPIYRPIEKVSGFHTQALLATPLSLENEIIGVMEAVHSSPDAFTDDHLRLLEAAGLWAAIAIGNARRHEDTRRLLLESEAMAAINQVLNETLDLGRILELIVHAAQRVIPRVERAVIHLLDEAHDELIPAAAVGLEAQLGEPEFTMRPGEGIAGRAVAEGRVINVPDTEVDPRFLRQGRAAHMRSLLVTPVASRARRLGTISVQSVAPQAFTAGDERLLATLAGQAALAIENARYFETERRRAEEAEALQRVTQTLIGRQPEVQASARGLKPADGGPGNPSDMLAGVVEAIANVTNCQHVGVYLVEAEGGRLAVQAQRGLAELSASHSSLAAGLVEKAAQTGQPALMRDTAPGSPRRGHTGAHSAIAVPLIHGGKTLGVLLARSGAGRLLDDSDLDWLNNVGRQLSVALENTRLYADLERALQQEKATRAQLVQTEKLAAMGRLVASVAHELNNPLQAIQNALYLVGREAGLGAQARDDLQVALAEADRMAGLIGRLRDTYRPTTAEQFGRTPLKAIVTEVDRLIATHLRHNNVAFALESDPNAPPVIGIHDQLKQVLLNLCLNAVEAMPGGGRLTVCVRSEPAADEVLVSVSDTGIGIDTAVLPNLFDPFYTTKEGGTGLGLAITYDIIRRHDGRIKVESQVGLGTTFKVWLPRWPESNALAKYSPLATPPEKDDGDLGPRADR